MSVFRLIVLLALTLVSWSGLGVATPAAQAAQQCAYPAGGYAQCDEGMAFAECSAALADTRAWLSANPGGSLGEACTPGTQGSTIRTFRCSYKGYSAGVLNPCRGNTSISSAYPTANTCAKRSSGVTPFFPPSGSVRCMTGCESVFRQNADETSTYSPNGKTCADKPDCAAQGKNMVWNGALRVCQPVEPECSEGQVLVGNACTDEKPCPDGMALVNGSCKKKDEECPAGLIRSPLGNCIPGDGQCAAGEVRGKDGTCKKDKDGDGEPDEGEEGGEGEDGPKDEFSGGDDCKTPPSCSGSPIMCGQARIQWRIDCNTRRNNNISGGQCTQAGTPTCTGEKCNAMEYTQLLMQWRSACAAEKQLAKDGTSPGASTTDANGNGVADALEGIGDATGPGDGNEDVASAKKWGIGVSTSLLDTDNMFGGGSCPEPPSFTMMGSTISGSDFPYFCRFAAIMRGLILVFGAFTAVQILMGRGFFG
ncbi:hypothetical protein K4043_01650 [Stenotrophomonas sp. SRS1]|uniref:virulence factor TspB C-terminal domain-related protein n=1 Tax=Stenotrophomonas sp. SRS1 TaxID=2870345 RepID=UPI002238EEF4|nr:virulence factor TspB C-terminal domain-related protein [Stenotrophomonas sp. SRS1]MCW6026713.1 hypothetical protein [Stenotrophomonas sp. SRS1]